MIKIEVFTSGYYTAEIEEERLIELYGHATDEDVFAYVYEFFNRLNGDEEFEEIDVVREERGIKGGKHE